MAITLLLVLHWVLIAHSTLTVLLFLRRWNNQRSHGEPLEILDHPAFISWLIASKLDRASIWLARLSGLGYAFIWYLGVHVPFSRAAEAADDIDFLFLAYGPHWYVYWHKPVLLLVLSQALWLKRLGVPNLSRALLAILIVLSAYAGRLLEILIIIILNITHA